MGFAVSVVFDRLDFLAPKGEGLPVFGAHLFTADVLRRLANRPEVDFLELFLPPSDLFPSDRLDRIAEALLQPERRGKRVLRFRPHQAIPEVWSDGVPRVLFTHDLGYVTRDRYLRDAFAQGPMPIACDVHQLGSPLSYVFRLLGLAESYGYDCFLCASEAMKVAMQKWLEISGASGDGFSFKDLPKAVDVNAFHPATPEEKARARKALNWPEDKVIALYLGRVTPANKADLIPLVRCFSEASTDEHMLAICGSEGEPGYFAKLYDAAATNAGRFRFVKNVPPGDRQKFYAAADLFVMPGDTPETFGLTLVEAMASGLPVIASDWGSFREIVDDGVTGKLVPTTLVEASDRIEALSPILNEVAETHYLARTVWVDTRALTITLRDLLANPDARYAMGSAGRAKAEAEYSWDSYFQRLFAIWQEQLQSADIDARAVAERRSRADELGFPTQYGEIFDHYASTKLDLRSAKLRLTTFGKEVKASPNKLTFSSEIIPAINPRALDSLLAACGSKEVIGELDKLCDAIAAQNGMNSNDVLFVLALLLKAGVFEVDG